MNKIYFNGDIVTVDEELTTGQAVHVVDGIINKVGSDEEVLKLKSSSTELIDLGGKTLVPGFIDGHSHFLYAISLAGTANCYAPPIGVCDSLDKMLEILKDSLKTHQEGVLLGWGYDHELLKEQRHPTKEDLDKVSTDVPILVVHASGHVGSMNSKMLDLEGINKDTKDPEGGVIYRDKEGNPTGYLEETAVMPAIFKSVPKPSLENMKEFFEEGQKVYTSQGITTSIDAVVTEASMPAYLKAGMDNYLDIDINGYVLAIDPNEGVDPTKYSSNDGEIKFGQSFGRFTLKGHKMFLDGSPQARTAWLTKPYEIVSESDDKDYVAYGIYSDKQVEEALELSFKLGTQIQVHANGDKAMDQLLGCVDKLSNKIKNIDKLRLTPVHCQTTREDQFDKMKKYGMTPTIFASHSYYWGDIHLKNFGKERAFKTSNCRYAEDIGLTYTLHDDTPVVPPNMLFGIWAACNRITRTGKSLADTNYLTPYEALKAVTIYGAYQYGEEDKKGSITNGKLADFVVLDKNPLKVDKSTIKDIVVLETIKEGNTIYSKEAN